MIQPNELRIGNLLIQKGEWYPIRSVRIVEYIPAEKSLDNIFEVLPPLSDLRINDISASRFEPIPLTEEWLLKFGFEKTNFFERPQKDHWLLIDHNGFGLTLRDSGSEFSFVVIEKTETVMQSQIISPKRIRFVHELQNLYFALTYRELEFRKELT